MKISLNWLKKYISFNLSPLKMATIYTQAVETFKTQSELSKLLKISHPKLKEQKKFLLEYCSFGKGRATDKVIDLCDQLLKNRI